MFAIQANAITITAEDSGHYRDTGLNNSTNLNYIISGSGLEELQNWLEVRNYFVFDLSSIGGSIMDAALRAYNVDSPPANSPGYDSPDASETWSLFEVTTDIGELTGSHPTGSIEGVAIFNDLGSGTGFGSTSVSDADNGTYVEVALNSLAISALNTANGEFAIGGAVTTLRSPLSTAERIFGWSHTNSNVELIVSTIPIPASVWLFGSGLLGLVGMARRKKA